ncbi:ZZ-type zinc finger-containing protein 3 [Bienertia sinuspersici]
MAAESNANFHQDTLGAGLHRHGISFQSGAVNSTSEMIPIGNYYGMNGNSGNLMFCENSSIINSSSPSTTPVGSSSGSLLVDSVPGLKHDAGLAVEWTEEEQYKLEEGLVKYKDEPSIMKYIKIAALLRDKTVRDVALRCRWMTMQGLEAYYLDSQGDPSCSPFRETITPLAICIVLICPISIMNQY